MKSILGPMLCCLIFTAQAQRVEDKKDTVFQLRAENRKTKEQITLSVGKTIFYLLEGSREYVQGRITEMTDSSLSFRNKEAEDIVILTKNIDAFKIRRKTGELVFGSIALAAGLFSVVLAMQFPPLTAGWFVYGIPGSLGIANGIILIALNRKIDLRKSWTLKPMTQHTVASSHLVRTRDKNGNDPALETMETFLSCQDSQ